VTGGAGYVGSHFVRALQRAGHVPVVVDDLATGHRDAVPADVAFCQGNIQNEDFVRDVIAEHQVDAVAHFAARVQVAESVRDPRRYYRENLRGTMALLEAMLDSGVRTIVAASSAAVYGNAERDEYGFCGEDGATSPDSPYGETKLAVERMLADYRRAYGLRYAATRCFNIAGADAGLAERHDPETHLIPLVLAAAEKSDPHFTVFGDDYPTPDGTAVRDYVHVMDVAEAHLAALERLRAGDEIGTVNVGSGCGYSVKCVVYMCGRVTGVTIPVTYGPRREGDPVTLIANNNWSIDALGWIPKRSSLERIVHDAWRARQ
jgi:UDP-glucose-4-epimerase GalE